MASALRNAAAKDRAWSEWRKEEVMVLEGEVGEGAAPRQTLRQNPMPD
jgi:hypothetical protein